MIASDELERPLRFGTAARNGRRFEGELGAVLVELEDERVVVHFEPAAGLF